jgi:hypothetical protein
MGECLHELRDLEGHQVCVALADGSSIPGCVLVSAPRRRAGSLWLVCNGEDLFVPLGEVASLWPQLSNPGHRAA